MPQNTPNWPDFISALACILILVYIQVTLGAPRMTKLKLLAANLPEHQRSKVSAIGPILAAGLRMQLVVLASLLPFLEQTTVFTGELSNGKHFALSAQAIILLIGASYLLLRLLGTLYKPAKKTVTDDEYSALGTLVWLDIAWTLEVVLIGLGFVENMAPILLAVLVAHLLLLFWSRAIVELVKGNTFIRISGHILFLFCILALVAKGISFPFNLPVFQLCTGLIIAMTLLFVMGKKPAKLI